jgi:GMP synthase-like glutamine amidotransferase
VRALLVANQADADAGFVGDRFRSHGYAFSECHREHPGEWPALDGHELVLLLGSEWSVYWPQIAGELSAEVELLRAARRRGVPVFGICFGHQVMSHAFGGTVSPAAMPEVGWYEIDTDLPAAVAAGPWLQWHYDVASVPPDAGQLARSAVGPQAWRLGRMFATQFHPEVTEAIVRRWSAGAGAQELARTGVGVESLLAQTARCVDDSRPNAHRLVDWFCETVAASPIAADQPATDPIAACQPADGQIDDGRVHL